MTATDEFMAYYQACPMLDPIGPTDVGTCIFIKNGELVGTITRVNDHGFEVTGTHLSTEGLIPDKRFIPFREQVYIPRVVDEATVLGFARRVLVGQALRPIFRALADYARSQVREIP